MVQEAGGTTTIFPPAFAKYRAATYLYRRKTSRGESSELHATTDAEAHGKTWLANVIRETSVFQISDTRPIKQLVLSARRKDIRTMQIHRKREGRNVSTNSRNLPAADFPVTISIVEEEEKKGEGRVVN